MTVSVFPTTIGALSDEWLTHALRKNRRLDAAESVEIAGHEPLSAGTSFATRMYRLRLAGTDALPPTAILKLPVEPGPIRTFLDAISAYARETIFYRDLAQAIPIRVPDCYVAEHAEGSTDFVLLIEDLRDATPGDSLTGLDHEQAEMAVDALARFHAWSWEHERLGALTDFPRLDGPVGRATMQQIAAMFAQSWAGVKDAYDVDGDLADFGDRFTNLADWFVDELATPRTIAHGELRADNLFLADDGLTLIDFQTVCQQSGMVDFSYLISQSLPLEVRRANEDDLLRRYHAALGARDYTFEDARRQYRVGVAFNLVWACLMHGQAAGLDERGTALVDAMLTRAFAAIADNDSLSLIP